MKFKDDLQRLLYYTAQIDYSYFRLGQIANPNNGAVSKSPIEAMIDKVTGFDNERIKLQIKETKYLVGVIIRCKEKLGHDATADKKILSEIKKANL